MRRCWGCCCYVDWESYHAERQAQLWAMRMAREAQLHPVYEEDDSLFRIKEGLTEAQRSQVLVRIMAWRVFSNEDPMDVDSPPASQDDTSQAYDGHLSHDVESQVIDSSSMQEDDTGISEAGTSIQQNNADALQQKKTSEDPIPTSTSIPDHGISQSDCSICLEAFIDGQIINDNHEHTFHRECLLEWLDNHLACPYCRKPLVTKQDWERGVEELGIVVPPHAQRNGQL